MVAAPHLGQRRAVPQQVRGEGRASRRPEDAWPTSAKFPFMTKTDLRDNYPFGLFAVPRDKVRACTPRPARPASRSSSATRRKDIDNWADLMARSIRAAGGRAGDMVHVAYGYGMFTGGLGAHYGAERLGCIAVPMSGGQTEKQVQQIMDFKPDIIMVTPVLLAGHRRGIRAPGHQAGRDLAEDRHLRRRTVGRRHARRDREASSASTPSTSTA